MDRRWSHKTNVGLFPRRRPACRSFLVQVEMTTNIRNWSDCHLTESRTLFTLQSVCPFTYCIVKLWYVYKDLMIKTSFKNKIPSEMEVAQCHKLSPLLTLLTLLNLFTLFKQLWSKKAVTPLHKKWLYRYESFSDVGEIRVYFASKILTPCRMHWNAFLIAQIIAKCHSFPNMYGMV